MSQPDKPIAVARFRGAILAGLFGVITGLIVGCVSIGVFIPFSDPNSESRKWLPGIAILFGLVGAFWGGLLGAITGAIFGAEAAIRGAATKGVLFGLTGIVFGFVVGVLVSGLIDRQWSLFTDSSTSCALMGGCFGIIIGTVLGARTATKAEHETSVSKP